MSLNGKIAIVTGAHQGIGQSTAIRLAADGAHVIAADLQDCEVTIKEITEAGHSAEAVRLDVVSPTTGRPTSPTSSIGTAASTVSPTSPVWST